MDPFESFKERRILKIGCLCEGYAKLCLKQKQKYMLVSTDILNLIALFYRFDEGFLATMSLYSRSSQIMKLHHLYSESEYNSNIYFIEPRNGFSPSLQFSKSTVCVTNNCVLPNSIKNEIATKFNHKLIKEENLLSSNKWNLCFMLYQNIYHITAIHPSFYSINKNNENERVYIAYNSEIPPNTLISSCINLSSSVYNKTDQILYSLSCNRLRSLDLSSKPWKAWNFVTDIEDNTELNAGSTMCMIDNNRFIGMIPLNSKIAKLFAINCNKTITLSPMIRLRFKSSSLYHNIFHKIINGNNRSIEWYDLNKDEWILITDIDHEIDRFHNDTLPSPINFYSDDIVSNIWYSNLDPQSIYYAVKRNVINIDDITFSLFGIDARSGQYFYQNYYHDEMFKTFCIL